MKACDKACGVRRGKCPRVGGVCFTDDVAMRCYCTAECRAAKRPLNKNRDAAQPDGTEKGPTR